MEPSALNVASARNRRRAQRRHARRLRLRVYYIQYAIADVRVDVIEVWIAAARANAGRLPAGLVPPRAVAAVQKPIVLPWRLIPSMPMREAVTRAMNAQGAMALGKEIAQNEERVGDHDPSHLKRSQSRRLLMLHDAEKGIKDAHEGCVRLLQEMQLSIGRRC